MITNPPRTGAPDILKGLIAGVAGGLLASLVMEQFQALWSKVAEEIKRAQSSGINRNLPGEKAVRKPRQR